MSQNKANWQQIASEQRDPQKRWHELATFFTSDESTLSRWYATLAAAYQSADRHYHNLNHISQMLAWIEYSWEPQGETRAIANYAAWFHDAVYDSKAAHNEEQSAALALKAAVELQVPHNIAQAAAAWILRTKIHNAGGSSDCAHFLDCDLAILGAPENLYQDYAAAIRREYAWVAKDAYRSGRSKVLEQFLGRDRIYITEEMTEKLEVQARSNLQNEIESLGR